MEFKHVPIMLNECIEGLAVKENGIYLDGTLGGGGHSKEIVKRLVSGKLIATDLDRKSDAADRSFTQRAWDMDIFLVADAAELTKEEWKQIFLNAMA